MNTIREKTAALLEMERIANHVAAGIADEKKATERLRELNKVANWIPEHIVADIFWRNGKTQDPLFTQATSEGGYIYSTGIEGEALQTGTSEGHGGGHHLL